MLRTLIVVAALVSGACRSAPRERALAAPPLDVVVSYDGLPLAYTDQGAGAPTLVFVHGWCGAQSQWAAQVDAFAGERRVVTLDLGGHGASGARRARWSLDILAGDVVALADGLLLDDVVLVGHSMGAPVALLAAARLRGRVRAVVGVAALHDASLALPARLWDEQLEAFRRDYRGAMDTFVAGLVADSADPALVARLQEELAGTPPSVAVALFESFRAFDPAAALAGARVPVRCINAVQPPTNVAGNRRHADFDVRYVEDCGHFVMLERPAAFNEALRATLADLDSPPMNVSRVSSLTPILVVDAIEPELDFWVRRLGWEKTMEVPDGDGLAFAMLAHDGVELMLQSRASVAGENAALAAEPFHTALYVKVDDLDAIERALAGCEVVFPRRETFYGSQEVGYRDPAGNPVTFAWFPGE
jgi:pimeloyl-ACP methyl ester carboxylesterase/uncharacterized glyoxalase superfamily protein PhnB